MRDRTVILIIVAVGLVLGVSLAMAEERRTIVGKWSTAAGKCIRPTSIIRIGPQSLDGDDFTCSFPEVSRQGDVVTFRGQCRFGADDPVRETVTARLKGEELWYGFRSVRGENGPFRRCP